MMTSDLQDSGKLFVTPSMALFTLTLFYTGLNQVNSFFCEKCKEEKIQHLNQVSTRCTLFSSEKRKDKKFQYLNQAIWGGVLTSSIGFTKK